ncbi:MAG: tetratricopeptide repeat protein [Helicobacteraceae bacterium]|jgi:tetratricopeptide (TPR) repeat protein|nr:tetratricopeptide repeat protein [Helicobacteraceae bacterium]
MDAKFIAIVGRLLKEQGADTLINAAKCKAFLNDYAKSEFKRERHLLMIAIEAGAAKEIANASDLDACKKIQIRFLRDELSIDGAAACEIIELLAFLLRDDQNQSIAQTAKLAPQSQYNPTRYDDESSLRRQTSDPPYQTPQNGDNARSAKANRSIGFFLFIAGVIAVVCFGIVVFINDLSSSYYQSQSTQKIAPPTTQNIDPQIAILKETLDKAKRAERLNDRKEAIRLYTKAIELAPDNFAAYSDRGDIYYALNDYKKAIADFSQAIKIDPNVAYVYNNRGNAYANLGFYSASIVDYSQAINISPSDAKIYNNRGYVYQTLNDYKKAIANYNQALGIDPNYAEAYNNRGLANYSLGAYSKAIADFNQAININPYIADAYNNRGNAYNDLGYRNKAIADYNQAITINPNLPYLYNNRGDAYYNMGDYKAAAKDARKACELGSCDLLRQIEKN